MKIKPKLIHYTINAIVVAVMLYLLKLNLAETIVICLLMIIFAVNNFVDGRFSK